MKKMALVMLGMFLLGNVGFATFPRKLPERKEFFKNLEALIEKYNKAHEQDKEAVRNKIAALLSSPYEEDIAERKKSIAKMKADISKMEEDKTAIVNEQVDYWVSEKGQKNIQQRKKMYLARENRRVSIEQFSKIFEALIEQYNIAAKKDKESVRKKIIDFVLKNRATGTAEREIRETNYAAYIQGRFKNTEFFKKFEVLIEKYNKASDQDKKAVMSVITTLVLTDFALPQNTKS
ncbi:MAG: hypothetical protein FWG57_00835 [Endomicrobia bacterium]|nr:hypothetical protein [Endomicrobiia bacterium]